MCFEPTFGQNRNHVGLCKSVGTHPVSVVHAPIATRFVTREVGQNVRCKMLSVWLTERRVVNLNTSGPKVCESEPKGYNVREGKKKGVCALVELWRAGHCQSLLIGAGRIP